MIIGLLGALGSGKTTVAMHLIAKHGFVRMRFADPLKAMLLELGLTHAQVDGDQKEVPAPILGGKTPRWAMQTLGTEWGRKTIDGDLWCRALERRIRELMDPIYMTERGHVVQRIVIDDLRFSNEHETIKRLKGKCWVVRRYDAEVNPNLHASEQYWRTGSVGLPVVSNKGTIEELRERVDTLMETMNAD